MSLPALAAAERPKCCFVQTFDSVELDLVLPLVILQLPAAGVSTPCLHTNQLEHTTGVCSLMHAVERTTHSIQLTSIWNTAGMCTDTASNIHCCLMKLYKFVIHKQQRQRPTKLRQMCTK